MGKEHVDDAEGNLVSQPGGSGVGGHVQTLFRGSIFRISVLKIQQGGYIRLRNSFGVNAQLQMNELY